jgi:hypothetical protein
MSNIFSLSGSGKPPASSSGPQAAAMDNLIRRELKVNDPRNPEQVAQALLTRYKTDPRALAIEQEAQGAPFLQSTSVAVSPVQVQNVSTREWDQAVSHVDANLHELTINALLRDELPEIKGWAQAIRTILTEGIEASSLALDARQRDKAFSLRRQLSDFARIIRLVGVAKKMTVSRSNYRSLARSLDEASSVMLVTMGETIANAGLANGQGLLQTPFSEMQARRDELMLALRGLTNSIHEANAGNAMPRGLSAYRDLLNTLSLTGQADLRSLLVESELLRATDILIQRAADRSEDGTRALTSVTRIELNRFNRLLAATHGIAPEPPLLSFLKALQLFIDAFDVAGGSRLLYASRPPVLFYGLYGGAGIDPGAAILSQLIQVRGILADKLDSLFEQTSAPPQPKPFEGDILLWSLDRAIDYYAMGRPDNHSLDTRAAVVAFLCEVKQNNGPADIDSTLSGASALLLEGARIDITKVHEKKPERQELRRELKYLMEMESTWDSLARSMAPVALSGLAPQDGSATYLYVRLTDPHSKYGNIFGAIKTRSDSVTLPSDAENSLERMAAATKEIQTSITKFTGENSAYQIAQATENIYEIMKQSKYFKPDPSQLLSDTAEKITEILDRYNRGEIPLELMTIELGVLAKSIKAANENPDKQDTQV